MLLELHISGLGVIDDVSLELPPGLSVLTGETGAGKTMITVGLALVLGRRARSGMVRKGARRGSVEARFAAGAPEAAREWTEDGELVLARTVSADGRSTARAGGQMAPLSTLAELGEQLVEVHGQHSARGLTAPAAQLGFLDRFIGGSHLEVLTRYRRAYARMREARAALRQLDDEEREREREKDLLAYQLREIEAARVRPGEVVELEAEEARLGHAERIRERMGEALAALADDAGGRDALRTAAAALRDVAELDPAAGPLAERLWSLAVEAQDLIEGLRGYVDAIDLDPSRLDAVRERIAAIRALERRYGDGEAEILSYLERSRQRLEELEHAGARREELSSEVERLEAEVRELGHRLGVARREAAPRLSAALEDELRELGMEGASVEVALTTEDHPGADGLERAALLFSGGPAQEPQPLSRVASGGELSRTMLACRTVAADLDDVPTLVFDEVDAGIGGRAGVAVGRRLARLATRRQVLVVTHLPQIACFADRHFRVTKEAGTARVMALEGEDRVAELSRMLSGISTEEAATHAEQLLAEAAREKS